MLKIRNLLVNADTKKYSLETAFPKVYNSRVLVEPIVEAYDFFGRNMTCACSSWSDRKYFFGYQVLNG